MKLSKLFKEKNLTLSFEVFPPKATSSYESVKKAVSEIAKLSPDYMSVTYGAGGGTSEFTSDIAANIKEEYGVNSLAHLTCVSSSREDVLKQIEVLKKSGIENILALRGDKKPNFEKGDFSYAAELIAEIKKHGDFCIGGACYPEGHTESETQAEDIKYLKEKVDAGCEFLTTQMFFDNNILYNFLYKIREAGITVPVVAGIMPVTNGKQIERICSLSGTVLPRRFISIVDAFSKDEKAMADAGIAYATDQIIDLYANGVSNVHVYSMNKPYVAEKITQNLKNILGR